MQEDAWVPMIPVDRATGAEADLYGGQAVGNVIRAMSLVPDEVRTLCDLRNTAQATIDSTVSSAM